MITVLLTCFLVFGQTLAPITQDGWEIMTVEVTGTLSSVDEGPVYYYCGTRFSKLCFGVDPAIVPTGQVKVTLRRVFKWDEPFVVPAGCELSVEEKRR